MAGGGMDMSGGGGDGGGGLMNLLMLNPRIRQMVQAQQQMKLFQQQQAARRGIGEIIMSQMGNQGQGTPIGPNGLYTGTPGQNTPPPGFQPPQMGGQQPPGANGLPTTPPGQASQPGSRADQVRQFQANYDRSTDGSTDTGDQGQGSNAMAQTPSQRRIGLNGQPVGPNPTVGDGQGAGEMGQGPRGGIGARPIGASFDPNQGGASRPYSYHPGGYEARARELAVKHGLPAQVGTDLVRYESPTGKPGDAGTSFSPVQLHYGGMSSNPKLAGKGLGDEYTAQTGKFAGDPKNFDDAMDWSMAYVAQHGQAGLNKWNGWKNAKAAGIGKGGTPEEGAFIQQGMANQLDWRTAARAYTALHPNARPEEVADSVMGMIPLMNQDSQAQFKEINAQLRQQTLELNKEKAATQKEQGQEKIDVQRDRLDAQIAKGQDALAEKKREFEETTDLKKKEQALREMDEMRKQASDLEKKRHDMKIEGEADTRLDQGQQKIDEQVRKQNDLVEYREQRMEVDRMKMAAAQTAKEKTETFNRYKQSQKDVAEARKERDRLVKEQENLFATPEQKAEARQRQLEVEKELGDAETRAGKDRQRMGTDEGSSGRPAGKPPVLDLNKPQPSGQAAPQGDQAQQGAAKKEWTPEDLADAKDMLAKAPTPERKQQILDYLAKLGYDISKLQ